MNPLGALALALAFGLAGCSSNQDEHSNDANASGGAAASDCAARAESLAVGLSKTSPSGARFTLTAMAPAMPVQSPGPPGNTWSVEIEDANAAPLSGALNVTTYMPDHGHSGPPTIGVESSAGLYAIDELVFPMPALYQVSLSLSRSGAAKESVSIAVCVEPASG